MKMVQFYICMFTAIVHTSFHNYVLLVKILPSRSSNVISVCDQTYQGSES